MNSTSQRTVVSERAVVQRINRKLAKQWQALRTARGTRWESDLGRHYVVDVYRNTIEYGHVDVEQLAREEGLLAEWEAVRDN